MRYKNQKNKLNIYRQQRIFYEYIKSATIPTPKVQLKNMYYKYYKKF